MPLLLTATFFCKKTSMDNISFVSDFMSYREQMCFEGNLEEDKDSERMSIKTLAMI